MTPEEQTTRELLAKHYGQLTDPRYAPDCAKAEARLKEACRACWQHKAHFPEWIVAYVKAWAKAAELRGPERTPDTDNDIG